MNPYITVLLSMLVAFLRSTLKSAKAIAALQKYAPIFVEARDLLDQLIDSIPAKTVLKAQKAVAAGKTFALKP